MCHFRRLETESKILADPYALKSLAEFPSIRILDGKTPISEIVSLLRVAHTEGLKIELAQHAPIFAKRDDLTPGFGNKTRKLEVILADALSGCDCLCQRFSGTSQAGQPVREPFRAYRRCYKLWGHSSRACGGC